MSDRILGLVLLILSAAYALGARAMEVGFLSDPVGPRTFPYLIAAILGISSLWLILRPDPEPEWPGRSFWIPLGLVLLSLVAYAYLLVPLGFIITTALEMTLLSLLFGAKPGQAAAGGLSFSVLVYLLFTQALSVPLPVGRIFG
ncbi:MAG TPA: tripartite tricarboxylate transporter TctB family protein [Meiothermus sp.]|jgi:putative tricarboxylic transport membrane protein|nr:tripartite tricarboxylate transporter TctB family protein [Meiothermus sp.]